MPGETVSPRFPVGMDDVVVRGGDMQSWKLDANAQTHFNDPVTRGEWAISVASLPGVSHREIVAEAEEIRQAVYRVAGADALFASGYQVLTDDPPHALVMLGREPDEEMWAELRLLFAEVFDNFMYEERRHRNG